MTVPKKINLQPALDACQNQLSLTFSASDSLDTKALGILGFDIALLIYVLQADLHKNPIVLAVSLLIFSISLALTVGVIMPKDYTGAIVNLNDHAEYLELAEKDLVLQLIADTQEAIDINTYLNNIKSKYCMVAIILSLSWTIFITGCII